jgi:Domain of unknown function (DUF4177)
VSDRWEYLVLDENSVDKITARLDALGRDGWELVALTGHGAQNKILAVLKRKSAPA